MRICISILSVLVLGLASCGGSAKPTTAASYDNALDAMDAAELAKANKEYGTAVEGFQYAYDNSTNAEMKAANGKNLYMAQVLHNDSAGAQATLETIGKEIGAAGLSELSTFCIQVAKDFGALNEVILAAEETLDEAQLAVFDKAKVVKAAELLAKGDTAGLAALGYVDPEE